MKTFQGALVLAGACAAFGLVGCAHDRTKQTQTPVGTQGTEMGTGGAGVYGGGMPSSTPTTTTPRSPASELPEGDDRQVINPSDQGSSTTPSSSMTLPDTSAKDQEGIGGSGTGTMPNQNPSVPYPNPAGINPDACNRNQIGSPGSSDVICDPKDMGPGGSRGMDQGASGTGSTTSSGSSSGAVSSDKDKSVTGADAQDLKNAERFHQDQELKSRSEERRVGKECRSRWSTYH